MNGSFNIPPSGSNTEEPVLEPSTIALLRID